ncbi:MAG: low molecular weight phosphatase family protein [Xanthobacteraceae bacterium]
MKTLLFLCTGNYYRSRFAEELFNHRAPQAGLHWIAQSRALAIECGIDNVGSLSPFVVRALGERGLPSQGANRPPQQCIITDLEAADRIVALNETEHRPLLLGRFPGWEQRVEYWHVGDVGVALPAAALNSIENEIESLLFALREIEPRCISN